MRIIVICSLLILLFGGCGAVDGPGMEYDWTQDAPLYRWEEVLPEGETGDRELIFSDSTITLLVAGEEKGNWTYVKDPDGETIRSASQETVADCDYFQYDRLPEKMTTNSYTPCLKGYKDGKMVVFFQAQEKEE